MTELVGITEPIEEQVGEQYEMLATKLLGLSNAPKALALCGTSPPGLHPGRMANIVSSRQPGKTLVFVDSAKDILPVLKTGCVDILKVNSEEITSISASIDSQHDSSVSDGIFGAAWKVANAMRIGTVAITDGPSKAYLVDSQKGQAFAFAIPDLLANRSRFLGNEQSNTDADEEFGKLTLNPLGAGDTCSAVMLNLILDGTETVEAFAQGLSAASASCLVPMPNCVFDRQAMKRIREDILVSQM
ncbi:hypothetical protein LPJ56_002040 [Coemansia sp. RSA 2599]|nr:hypothetical protein LPJ75_001666 [Coemansia sp. RSA 2598]KAJ1826724.1 hypothetical protein LPJ56_002040 [Coemansia sp. RSA 2599]